MGQIGELIASTMPRSAGLAAAMLNGIDPKDPARMPVLDGKHINCNHPVFAYGHLAIYPQKIMAAMGREPGETVVPETYNALFAAGVDCVDDPKGKIYPPLGEVAEHFTRAYAAVTEAVRSIEDAVFAKPIEGNERAREVFGHVGSMTMFMMHDHYMFHAGQVSTWRRAMGLGSVM